MNVLLDQKAPGLAKRLTLLPVEARRSILARACLIAGEYVVGLEPAVRDLLNSLKTNRLLSENEVAKAVSLAEAADAKYLELRAQGAEKDKDGVLKFFSEARLLTAMSTGFGGTSPQDSADAVYELCKTCDDPSALIRSIESDIDSISAR
jgi:hypothetical protein